MTTSEAWEILTCDVCFMPFDEEEPHLPRILPCNVHSLCTACIQQTLNTYPDKPTFLCPVEGIDFPFANKTIEDFPVNNDLMTALQIVKNDELEKCDETPDDQKCLKHNLIFESICFDCKEPICSHCETDEHERHFFMDQEDIEAYLEKAERNQFDSLEKYKKLKDEGEKIIEEITNDMKTYIAIGFDEMIDFLTEKKNEALGKVDTFIQGKVRTCSQIDKSLNEELEKLQKSRKKIEEIAEELNYEGIIAKYRGAGNEEKERFNAYCDMILGMKNLEKKELEGVMEKKRKENVKIRQTLAPIKCSFNEMAMEMLRQVNFVEFQDPSLAAAKKETPRATRKPEPEHEGIAGETRHPRKYREGRQGQGQSEEEMLFSRLSEFDEENDPDNEDEIVETLKRLFQIKWGISWEVLDENNMIIDASSSFVDDQEISEIVSFFKSLKKKDQVMRIIAEKAIVIKGCFHIQTDDGLEKLGKIFSYMNSLREVQVIFKECLNVSEEGFLELGRVLSRLKKLRKLSIELHRCKSLELVKTIDKICSLSKLEHFVLSLSKCHKVTAEGLKEMLEDISEMSSGVTFDLEIRECKKINKSHKSMLKKINNNVHKIKIEEYIAGGAS